MTPPPDDRHHLQDLERDQKGYLDFSTPVADDAGRGDETGNPRSIRRVGLIGAGILLFVLGIGTIRHVQTDDAAASTLEAFQHRVPMVELMTVHASSKPLALDLPGTMEAFDSATIYARASGYIAERKVDIGSRIKAGDLLLKIAAPEIDDQLSQARAQLVQMQAALQQAEANATLAARTEQRTQALVVEGWQTKQQGDQDRLTLTAQRAAVQVAEANLKAQQAQVERLTKQQDYEQVVAPFDGVITARNIDVGSLVTADVSTGTPLLAIARSAMLRVQIYVPQDAAFTVKQGVTASVKVPEIPGRIFTGQVARTADALQAGTRTLLVEVDIDNADGALTPGLYCTVDFNVPRENPAIVIPADALIFNQRGLQVATYENGSARLRPVRIGRDDGAEVEIATGLGDSDQLILRPPVDLVDGAKVQPAPEQQSSTAN